MVGNGTPNEEDAVKPAKEASLVSLKETDPDITRAIKESLIESQTVVVDSNGTAPPPQKPSSDSGVVFPLSPAPAGQRVDSPAEHTKRVQKRAFKRSLETTEVLQTDNPIASPEHVAASPHASRVFNELANACGRPTVASYLNHCVEANPMANSQEGHEAAADFMRDSDGKPKKKKSKKKRRNKGNQSEPLLCLR